MRHYVKGAKLRAVGRPDWQERLLTMMLRSKELTTILRLEHDPAFPSAADKAKAFDTMGFGSRSTYMRRRRELGLTRPYRSQPEAEEQVPMIDFS